MGRLGFVGVVLFVAASLAAGVAAAQSDLRLSPSARLGPAPSLCKMDPARGSIPAAFALDGCVNLSGIWIRDTRSIPVRVTTSGSVSAAQVVRAANATLAANATWGLRPNRASLLMPGQIAYYPVGTAAGSVTISNDTAAANTYLVADGILTVLGGTSFGSKLKGSNVATATAFVAEVTDDLQQYHGCATGASFVKRAGCDALLVRNLGFAFGRMSFSLGKSVVSKTISLVIAAAHQWNFTLHLNGDLNAISNGHGTIALRALAPSPPPALNGARVLNFWACPASDATASGTDPATGQPVFRCLNDHGASFLSANRVYCSVTIVAPSSGTFQITMTGPNGEVARSPVEAIRSSPWFVYSVGVGANGGSLPSGSYTCWLTVNNGTVATHTFALS